MTDHGRFKASLRSEMPPIRLVVTPIRLGVDPHFWSSEAKVGKWPSDRALALRCTNHPIRIDSSLNQCECSTVMTKYQIILYRQKLQDLPRAHTYACTVALPRARAGALRRRACAAGRCLSRCGFARAQHWPPLPATASHRAVSCRL